MNKLQQLVAILIVAMVFTACSSGYYAHLPRAKTTHQSTVKVIKKEESTQVETIVSEEQVTVAVSEN